MRRRLVGLAVSGVLLTGGAAGASVVLLSGGEVRASAALPVATLKDVDKAAQAADVAWVLMATALVLLMVPGLALFYGGMVRRKNVLGTMMHSMAAPGVIGLQWVLVGYALAFGASQGGWIGWSPEFLGLSDPVLYDKVFPGTRLPVVVHALFQGMFAILAPALISGAFAERVRFGPYCLFLVLWTTLVYDPLAHWVWAVGADGKPAGWLGRMGALDFAGGTVVHVAAGFAGLTAVRLLRPRLGYPQHVMYPNSMVLTLLGAGLLWCGGFGFTGGRALAANALAGNALAATQVAAAAGGASWVLVEWLRKGKPTALGLASGVVAGLVAVTPACGYVTPLGALTIGLLAGVVCYAAVCLRPGLKYDDSLDTFGVYGVGGFLGVVLTGAFASAALYKAGSGSDIPSELLAAGHRFGQVGVQLMAAAAAAVYSFAATALLVKLIDLTVGFCLEPKAEAFGLDRYVHGEVGFDLNPVEEAPVVPGEMEPRSATVPPEGKRRFTVVIEGPAESDLLLAWSSLCQASSSPPSDEFKAVYPYLTTVTGNRFHFRGGDPVLLRQCLERLFEDKLDGTSVQTYVEN